MNNEKGFTLTEIIVVLVILAVLAAFAIPTMLGFVSHSQESLCDTQRKDIVRLFETQSRMTPGLNINTFAEENYGDEAHLCPGGGICYGYSYYESENQAVGVMYCSEHTTVADGRLYLDTLVLLDKIKDMTDDKDIQKYLGIDNNNLSNDNYRAKILAENGGEWERIPQSVLDATTYQKKSSDLRIQPYFFGTTRHKPTESIIYANTAKDTTGNNLWETNLVFNHENGKWYEYIVKHSDPHNDSRVSFKMTDLNGSSWADFKEELEDTSKWQVVER
ncbi:prepilin-type N-terminal cleavage/methylation domain-containing protein [Acetobacterium malicum]|uniref:Prepilin-type N-terminal cleavage/methylation domain-containing protein n=1 Tax=Acetobacterium malicum TaxID=52692 RepID=A0ABR6YXF8_9FIRM|nr:prepilin-type N-terminal cleavage/methylation domain-containing protein [Acetobacterium malicum]MBC3899900.1 prepilin-type N-terminal cleavage/methylation domain-containing protein [Acetobacterium malicum]